MRGCCQVDQVVVAGLVFGEQQEMIVAILAGSTVSLAVKPAAGRNVHLAANNRFYPRFASGLIKVYRAVHHPMIRNGERWKFQFHRAINQLVQSTRSVEHRELGMHMEMDKLGLGHAIILAAWRLDAQADEICRV